MDDISQAVKYPLKRELLLCFFIEFLLNRIAKVLILLSVTLIRLMNANLLESQKCYSFLS